MIDSFLQQILVGFFVGSIAGVLGSLMIIKRMALVSGPLGHLALPGVALSLVYNFNMFLGALLSILAGSIVIWILKIISKLHLEVLVGIVFASFVALGFLFLPMEHAEEALVGNILKINLSDLLISFLVWLIGLFVLWKIYSKMILLGISEELAKNEEIHPKKYYLIYLVLIALICALSVKIIGILLTAALTILPAVFANNLSRNINQYFIISFLGGGIGTSLGILLSKFFSLPAGPLIILIFATLFVISLIFKRK